MALWEACWWGEALSLFPHTCSSKLSQLCASTGAPPSLKQDSLDIILLTQVHRPTRGPPQLYCRDIRDQVEFLDN